MARVIAIAVIACVGAVWGAAALVVLIVRVSQITDDVGCYRGTPLFAVAQAIIAAVGVFLLVAATRIAITPGRPRPPKHLGLSASGALVAGVMWLAMVTVWNPGNPVSPGPC